MVEESRYCSDVMKKLVMTEKVNGDFKNSTKCWICINAYVEGDVTVTDHCSVTGKYRGSAHRDCNIKFKLNQKICVVFQKLKNYDPHLIMQELDKFNFKINFISKRLEKYTSYNINDNLVFIDSFQFLSSSLEILVKNLTKDNFKHLSQEFCSNVLDLVKQKEFYLFFMIIEGVLKSS